MSKAKNLVGEKHNRLKIIDQYYKYDINSKRNRLYCLCICDCGNKIEIRHDQIIGEVATSCGCYQKEVASKPNLYDLTGKFGIGISNNTEEEFYFDLDDYNLIKDYGWSVSSRGYLCARSKDIQIKIHRLIMGFPDNIIDHANRNKLDNRKENLRIANTFQSSQNRGISKKNKTGIIGVSFGRRNKEKFHSYIYLNRNKIELGEYNNFNDAVYARLLKEKELFGEFAPQRNLFKEYGIE